MPGDTQLQPSHRSLLRNAKLNITPEISLKQKTEQETGLHPSSHGEHPKAHSWLPGEHRSAGSGR